jgi:hypothetical protein
MTGRKMARLTYLVYRDSENGFRSLLPAAIGDYRTRYGRLPGTVVVHPSLRLMVESILETLELRVPVGGNGGCASVEVWLPVPEVEGYTVGEIGLPEEDR